MARIRVLLLLLVASCGVLCNASKIKEKETKRTTKPVEFKKIEKKSTNEKRESAEQAGIYSFGQKEEPFRPIYQFHYPAAPLKAIATNYVTPPTSPQLLYNRAESAVPINEGLSNEHSVSNGDNRASSRSIQYPKTNAYKTEVGIQYAPSSYKSGSEDASKYASNAFRGPFVGVTHHAQVGQARSHSEPLYSDQPVHTSAPQAHHQNQYAIALPAEYIRHYQQNLAAPFPLHTAQMVQLIYAHNSGPQQTVSPPAFKDQQYKQGVIQYVTLAPTQAAHPLVAGPGLIAHLIPFYGPGGLQHQQVQQPPPAAFYYGANNQQAPPASLVYATTLPHQQQSIQKQHVYGPIQITAVGTAAAPDLVSFKPAMVDPVQKQQQLQQQTFTQFYQHYHPGAAGYTRYSQSPSGFNGSGGSSNPVEVPTYEAGSSSALKQGPLYSSPSSTNNPGNTYSESDGSSGGKMPYTYGSDPNYEGPMYAHPGAIHYGTHLYHPSRNVVQIGSKPVTAGSAAIAGISPPSYHPQQQSPANNSRGDRSSSSSVVMKFA